MSTPKKKIDKKEFYTMLRSGVFADMVKEAVRDNPINSPEEFMRVVKPLIAKDPDREQFWVAFLDAKRNVIDISLLFKGSITTTLIHPREILKKVFEHNAVSIAICHNHPGGTPEPSEDDLRATMNIIIALRSSEVQLQEHLIIGVEKAFSMYDNGIITMMEKLYMDFIKYVGHKSVNIIIGGRSETF